MLVRFRMDQNDRLRVVQVDMEFRLLYTVDNRSEGVANFGGFSPVNQGIVLYTMILTRLFKIRKCEYTGSRPVYCRTNILEQLSFLQFNQFAH